MVGHRWESAGDLSLFPPSSTIPGTIHGDDDFLPLEAYA